MLLEEWIVLHQQKLLEHFLKQLKELVGEGFGESVRALHAGINGRTFEETERLFLDALIQHVTGRDAQVELDALRRGGWPSPAPQIPRAWPPPIELLAVPVATPSIVPLPPTPPPPGALNFRAGWSPEQWGQDAGIREASSPVTSLPPVATPLLEEDGLPPLPDDAGVGSATPPLFVDEKARAHFVKTLGILRNELRLMRMSCPDHNWLDLQRCGILTPEIVSILRLVDKTNKSIDWRTKRERRALEKSAGVRGHSRNAGRAGT